MPQCDLNIVQKALRRRQNGFAKPPSAHRETAGNDERDSCGHVAFAVSLAYLDIRCSSQSFRGGLWSIRFCMSAW